MKNLKRSQIDPMPEYFGRYINLVRDTTLDEALSESLRQIDDLDMSRLERIGLEVYQPGKWTINSVIQHITDFERIFAYRALVYARAAGITPQGIDEQVLAVNSNADSRNISEVIRELRSSRVSTIDMFAGFDDRILAIEGKIWKEEMSVLAMGFNMIGHQIHHFNVLAERYFPLAEQK